MVIALPPALSINAVVSFAVSRLMSTTATDAPSRAKSRAVARPIPTPDPVINADFPNSDPTAGKDWTVRGRYTGGVVDAAVSYYKGRNLIPLTGADIITDKTRFGADVQGYYQLPTLGGGSLKGEFYQGHDENADSSSALLTGGAATNPRLLKSGADAAHLATDVRGWYAMWVQNLGDKLQVAARHDRWDPNTRGAHDQYARTSLALHYFYDGNTRLTVSYDAIKSEKKSGAVYADPKDNLLIVQLQHKF